MPGTKPSKPNYVEKDTVADADNPGYAKLRDHVFFAAAPAPTYLGASTPAPEAGLTRINKGINDPVVQQNVVSKLETLARNQEIAEALEDVMPQELISVVQKF